MKYVAFLDIIGFKETLKLKSQNEAKDYMNDFSSVVYRIWNNSDTDGLNGNIVSDSLIIYSKSASPDYLFKLINIIIEICREQFSENSILIRGGLAKGEFDKIPAKELNTLSKNLIVGQAYIDAYILEGSSKSFGITIKNNVYNDLENISFDTFNIIENTTSNTYIIRYIDIDFLLKDNSLESFVKLAKQSKWIPHYYNSLAYAIRNEKNPNKVDELFYRIIDLTCDKNPGDNYSAIDTFIENIFTESVDSRFKKRFLRFIRQRLIKP